MADEEVPVSRSNSGAAAVEVANTPKSDEAKNAAKSYDTNTAIFWLSAWLLNNLFITLANKAVFSRMSFPYPYTLTAVHMICNTTGAYLFLASSQTVTQKHLSSSQKKTILWFSVLFAGNIVAGNVSLRYVSVAFNQVMRALVPVTVMVVSTVFLGKSFSTARKQSILPVMLGVGMACWGDMAFTYFGFGVTMLAVLFAASKAIVSGLVLTDMQLHPVDLISRMAPLAFIWASLLSTFSGELTAIHREWDSLWDSGALFVVLLTGITSFSLNLTSFYSNKATSPLSLCIAANVKQVLVILLSIAAFGTHITPLNGLGICFVIAGGARYSYVGYKESTGAK